MRRFRPKSKNSANISTTDVLILRIVVHNSFQIKIFLVGLRIISIFNGFSNVFANIVLFLCNIIVDGVEKRYYSIIRLDPRKSSRVIAIPEEFPFYTSENPEGKPFEVFACPQNILLPVLFQHQNRISGHCGNAAIHRNLFIPCQQHRTNLGCIVHCMTV